MPKITLVKNNENKLVGLSPSDKKSWQLFKANAKNLEQGEMIEITTRLPRVPLFHRMHMKMEQDVFMSQDRVEIFENFRNWLKVGSGFVNWMAGAKGGVIPIPKSISYADCDEGTMREFHENSITFLLGDHAAKYLWRHLPADQAAEMMQSILERYIKYEKNVKPTRN